MVSEGKTGAETGNAVSSGTDLSLQAGGSPLPRRIRRGSAEGRRWEGRLREGRDGCPGKKTWRSAAHSLAGPDARRAARGKGTRDSGRRVRRRSPHRGSRGNRPPCRHPGRVRRPKSRPVRTERTPARGRSSIPPWRPLRAPRQGAGQIFWIPAGIACSDKNSSA